MYEQNSQMYLEALFSSSSFSDFLNKSEYFEQIAAYDQKMLAQYKETRKQVEETEARLEKEKEELDEMKASAEAEHEKFSGLINKTKGNISSYSNQIAGAEAQVAALEAQIEEQNKNISALQKQLAEEMAKSRLAANSSWRDISEVSFTEDDRYLLANLIYCEAGGEPYDGQVAVGAVVINRVLSSVYPSTLSGVVYQNRQFEPVSTGRLALALAENRATASCYRAADEAMRGMTNVGNCVYFRTPIPGLEGIGVLKYTQFQDADTGAGGYQYRGACVLLKNGAAGGLPHVFMNRSVSGLRSSSPCILSRQVQTKKGAVSNHFVPIIYCQRGLNSSLWSSSDFSRLQRR